MPGAVPPVVAPPTSELLPAEQPALVKGATSDAISELAMADWAPPSAAFGGRRAAAGQRSPVGSLPPFAGAGSTSTGIDVAESPPGDFSDSLPCSATASGGAGEATAVAARSRFLAFRFAFFSFFRSVSALSLATS